MTGSTPSRLVASPARAAQDRLRSLGLPLLLEPSVRARALLDRTAALLVGLAVACVGYALSVQATSRFTAAELADEAAIDVDDPRLPGLAVSLVVLLAAPLVVWLAVLVVRRLPRRARPAVSVVGIAGIVLAPTVLVTDPSPPWPVRVLIPIAVLAATYAGLGTMLAWAGRRAVRELGRLGPMVSRVLPVLMLAVLFVFFNAEMWQIADRLSMPRTWAAVAVLAALCVVLVAVNARDEVRTVVREHERAVDGPVPLGRTERLNVLAVSILVTLMQVVIFSVLVFCFLVAFGSLAIPDATVQQWVGRPPAGFDGWLGRLPVSRTLVQVSLFLAAFSALNFAAGSSADRAYRRAFVDPALEDVREGLQVRQAYRRRGSGTGA